MVEWGIQSLETANIYGENMSRSDDLDDHLKRIEEKQRGWKTHGFLPIEGEPIGISPELEFAVSTFVRIRYRGIDQWEIYTVYRFTDDGIQRKTYVVSSPTYGHVQFTDEEAIARHSICGCS